MEDKKLIYLVDDQVATLHTVAEMLKDLYRVKPFNSGKTMLECFENETPDLILLDYEMPNMNGSEVFEILNLNKGSIKTPVIFLTGSANADIEADLLEKGAADFIHKPIKAQILLARVNTQIELANYYNYMEKMVLQRTAELRAANDKLTAKEDIILGLLAKTADLREQDDGSHSWRTTEMVKIMLNDLMQNPKDGYTLTRQEADYILKTARLHDLGKIGVPDSILLKRGKLTEAEFEQFKYHTICGTMLFEEYIFQSKGDSFLTTARDIAMCHHEKWDGSGYPYGRKGEEIPLSARITTIVDEYNEMTSARPNKSAIDHEKAVKAIKNGSGKDYDPYLVEVFLRKEGQFKEIAGKSKTKV